MNTTTIQTFNPPGPGSWLLDYIHWTRPVTRFMAEIYPEQFRRGFQESSRRYGLLLDYIDIAFVNGFPYACPRPVGAPEDATGHPPRHVWNELMEDHPEISERLDISEHAFEHKIWRDDLWEWDHRTKPAAIRAHRNLQAIDPSTLPTDALLAHLDRCREHLKHQFYLHHRYNAPAFVPIGDFLAHAVEWTGRPMAELHGLLRGATPVSRGSVVELQQLAQAIRSDPNASELMNSSDAPDSILGRLGAMSDSVASALTAYLDVVGYRILNGDDVGEPYGLEVPEILVSTIQNAVTRGSVDDTDDGLPQRIATIRDSISSAHRTIFDSLLAEARIMYRLREERSLFCNLWAEGIVRRAILSAGKILADGGRIEQPAHLVETTYAEMRALIAHGAGPSAEELASRADYRTGASFADAPPVLGPEPGAPLPADWLPPAAARMERGMQMYLGAVFMAPEANNPSHSIKGVGVSPGAYEGTARIITDTRDFVTIRQGDVLVTRATSAAFNTILPLLGAVVTDRGGLLSHAAIVAREYGIPAVVGCIDASSRIPDNARIRVDGFTGDVAVLA